MKIKVYSNDNFPFKKNIHNVVTLIKTVFNKNYNHHYYQVFCEKFLYK